MSTKYVVMSSSANMPNSCWGVYRRVAVVEIDPEALPAGRETPYAISPHYRGVVRIVRTWERLNVGRTDACAYRVAFAEAESLAASLNAGGKEQ